ncbi:hypothetical protein [Flectobacillus roseus]|uniref:hypothetical protein n=1 Tax=Flectobacillus roseus TaxID=502259 RepID=UPI0024B811C9|nr:hypothetical protein [Flectobacillus roseus]MDI9870588.1 hypothetical protein [Flectobacillus roseus]
MRYLLILIALIVTQSCVTFQKCQDKFGKTTVGDTVTITKTVTLSVPKDSIVTTYQNDTVTFYKEIQQGRARLIIEKTPIYTTIKADCDSVQKTTQVQIKYVPIKNTWGVKPIYKTGFLVLLGVVLFLLLYVSFNYLTTKHQGGDVGQKS